MKQYLGIFLKYLPWGLVMFALIKFEIVIIETNFSKLWEGSQEVVIEKSKEIKDKAWNLSED